MNKAEKLARASAVTQSVFVPVTYQGFKCRPAGCPRQRRHKWRLDGPNRRFVCKRCGAIRNPKA
jgi:hypothetical protein